MNTSTYFHLMTHSRTATRYDSGRWLMFPLFHTSVTVLCTGEGEPMPRISADAVVHVWLDA